MRPRTERRFTAGEDNLRVLVTGFGPFGKYEVNPSWLAVEPLHDTVILPQQADAITKAQKAAEATRAEIERLRKAEETANAAESARNAASTSGTAKDQSSPTGSAKPSSKDKSSSKTSGSDEREPARPQRLRPIHIKALQIPMEYDAVLEIVPPLFKYAPRHPFARVLPIGDGDHPPYDFIFHIGVCGRGPLRMERVGHQVGYVMKDAVGNFAPVVPLVKTKEQEKKEKEQQEEKEKQELERKMQLERKLVPAEENQFPETPSDLPPDPPPREKRGFPGVNNQIEDLLNDLEVSPLIMALKDTGIEQIYTSMDAGHYLADFLYYYSLATAQKHHRPYEKGRLTQVLLLHCPPVNQPLSTEEVTEAIKRIIVWVCEAVEKTDADLQREAEQILPIREGPMPEKPTQAEQSSSDSQSITTE